MGGCRIARVCGSCVLRRRGGRSLAGSCVDVQLPALVGSEPCDHRQEAQIPKLFNPCNTTFINLQVCLRFTYLLPLAAHAMLCCPRSSPATT